MKKRALAVCLTAMMAAGTVACGASPVAQNTASDSAMDASQSAEASGGAATGENEGNPVVTFSYPTLVVTPTPEGTAPVEDALNQYLASIGKKYTVDLNPIDGNNYATQTDMAIMSNENIGIYCPLTGLSNAVSGNKLLPLDDYMATELKPVADLEGDQMLKSGQVNGVMYAMPCFKGYILNYYWVVDKDIFDATGFSRKDITDIRSLTPILEKIHEQHPDIAAIAPSLGLNGSGNSYCQLPTMADPDDYKVTDLGSNLGLIVEGDSTTVEDMYETKYFKEACELAYEWNQKGLTVKDASVSTDTPTDTQQAGRAASNIIGYGNSAESVAAFTKNTYAFPISKTMMASNSLVWGIATNCAYPKEAADFLSLLYTDLLLHTIVENAFKYARTENNSLIFTLNAAYVREENFQGVLIEYEDTGAGFTEEMLGSLENATTAEEQHVGLANLRRTMEIQYGDRHLLKIMNAQPHGARIEIRIPELNHVGT